MWVLGVELGPLWNSYVKIDVLKLTPRPFYFFPQKSWEFNPVAFTHESALFLSYIFVLDVTLSRRLEK